MKNIFALHCIVFLMNAIIITLAFIIFTTAQGKDPIQITKRWINNFTFTVTHPKEAILGWLDFLLYITMLCILVTVEALYSLEVLAINGFQKLTGVFIYQPSVDLQPPYSPTKLFGLEAGKYLRSCIRGTNPDRELKKQHSIEGQQIWSNFHKNKAQDAKRIKVSRTVYYTDPDASV